jgi:DNA-3-methyladenine glycosylase I
MKIRCGWCEGSQLYQDYHDQEWGVPCYADLKLFEMLVLETQQAGLSWITVLNKRENYREAFNQFDPQKIAAYDDRIIDKLVTNEGLIRHRKKLEAIVTNAKCYLELVSAKRSFSDFLWTYVDHRPINNHIKDYGNAPASTEISDRLSKDLKKLGFKFIGSTTVYAFMQAVGMVNDHEVSCFRHAQLSK